MTQFQSIKFTAADFIKLIGFVGMVGSMWYDLKSQQIETKKDMAFLQYQINEVKSKIGLAAIMPKETKIESEK